MDHNSGLRKIQMLIARQLILKAFIDADRKVREHMFVQEFSEMAQELQGLLKLRKVRC